MEVESPLPPRAPQLRAAFEAMDQVNVVGIFRYRAAVMKTVPRFLHGPFRNVMKVVLEEMASEDPTGKERGWKAFLMLSRMLFAPPPLLEVVTLLATSCTRVSKHSTEVDQID